MKHNHRFHFEDRNFFTARCSSFVELTNDRRNFRNHKSHCYIITPKADGEFGSCAYVETHRPVIITLRMLCCVRHTLRAAE